MAARVGGRSDRHPCPSPLYIGGRVGWGGPPTPQTHLGPAAKEGGGDFFPPKLIPLRVLGNPCGLADLGLEGHVPLAH